MSNTNTSRQIAFNVNEENDDWTPDKARQLNTDQTTPRRASAMNSNPIPRENSVYSSIRALSFFPGDVAIRNNVVVATSPPVLDTLTSTSLDPISSSKTRSYWQRRTQMYSSNRADANKVMDSRQVPGSIITLPIDIQVKLRRKVLLVFAIQLAWVTMLLSLLTYVKTLDTLMHQFFANSYYLFIAVVILLAVLLLLNKVQSIFPLNWIAMILFTIVFAVFSAGIQVVIGSHAGIYCGIFTIGAILITTVLCTKYRIDDAGQPIFASSVVSSFAAFVILAILTGIINSFSGSHYLSSSSLSNALILEFLVVLWFGYDMNIMFRLITPDEYMLGVIYFYTDLLVIAVMSIIATCIVVIFSSCLLGSGGRIDSINWSCCICGPNHCYRGSKSNQRDQGGIESISVIPMQR